MGVYIKGIEMPTVGRILIVLPSGRTLEVSADSAQNIFREAQAVPVPKHGRLIDARYIRDAIITKWMDKADDSYMYKCGMSDAYEVIRNAPTIIPTEEGEG